MGEKKTKGMIGLNQHHNRQLYIRVTFDGDNEIE